MLVLLVFFFFFKQKTAYEMRIRDWSSDGCSSDLEVAGSWLTVAAYRQQMELARQTLESQRKTLALTERKHALGVASGVDLASVQGSVESDRADVANYGSELEQARNALARQSTRLNSSH